MTDDIRVDDCDGVRMVRFNRAAKKNAITRAMYSAMAQALDSASADASVRVVVIAGTEGVFTAGNDLMDFMEAPPHIGGAETPPVEHFMRALIGCEKPVIAAVDGLAIGIGVTLLLHCDLAYTSDRSVFRTPFVDLALVPEFGSSVLLPGLAGRAVAGELLLLGETWNAARAGAGRLPLSKVMESRRLSGSYPTRVPGKVGRLTGSWPNAVSPTSAPPEASSIRTRSASHGEVKETERQIRSAV